MVNYTEEKNNGLEVCAPNNQKLINQGVENLPINLKSKSRLHMISKVTYFPHLTLNLLSVRQLASKGFTTSIQWWYLVNTEYMTFKVVSFKPQQTQLVMLIALTQRSMFTP